MFHPKGPTFWELAVQALSSTERGYDLLAPKFEFTPFRTPDVIFDSVDNYLKTIGPVDAGLDICCGTGAALRMLRPHCRQRVVGIDMSAGMLEEARRLTYIKPESPGIAVPGLSNVDESPGTAVPGYEFVRADALAMPFESAFDIAVSFGAFGHILPKDEPRFVAEIARVLRPGGRFVFVTHEMPHLWSPAYWLARGFNAAMYIRNLLIKPPFIMFYLTFLYSDAKRLLEANGFDVHTPNVVFPWPWSRLILVDAVKK